MKKLFSAFLPGSVGFALGAALMLVLLRHESPSADSSATDTSLGNMPDGVAAVPISETPRPAEPVDPKPAEAEAIPAVKPAGYIVDTDIAWMNERMTARVKRLVDNVMADRGPEYDTLFAELEIPAEARAGIKDRIAQLYRRRAEAGITMSEMVQAQAELENHMKRFSTSTRDEYLDFEEATKARTEVRNIANFLTEQGVTITQGELQRLQPAIQRHGAYTRKTTSGACSPFDPPSVPFTGRAIIPRFEARYRELSAASAAVVANDSLGLSDATIALIREYYASELDYYEEQIQKARDGGYGRNTP